VAFAAAGVPGAPPRALEFWRTAIADDLSLSPGERLGSTLAWIAPSPPAGSDPRAVTTAGLYRSDRGLIALASNLAATGSSVVSFQGYDWPRKAWSYLQGGSLVLPVAGIYGRVALVSLNGADLSPLDRVFPVLHWPVAAVRAGIDAQAGAAMLLKGRTDFELDPDPGRLVAKWSWGDRSAGTMAVEQRLRQWSLMQTAPAPLSPRPIHAAELVPMIAGGTRPEGYVLRETGGRPVAILVHWSHLHCLAIVAGESLAGATGSLFVSTARGARIETAMAAGVRGLRMTRVEGETLFLPLGLQGKGP
jgi:hypothetical protein